MTRRANMPCGCGSGKPYKKCHREQDKGMTQLFERIQAGEIPFRAQVISENDEPSSMQIGKVVVTQGGDKRVLTEDMLTLNTNSVPGDKTKKSAASISIPIDGSSGTISTTDNATVSNGKLPLELKLSGGVKRLKTSSASEGFAIAQIRRQNDTNSDYFDILFGSKGQAESVDESGRKNRPHVALHPDGNGKFFRLADNGCEIITEQSYKASESLIAPRSIKIRSPHFSETLVAEFTAYNDVIELTSLMFE